jgi:subtilase family serine protease
LVNVTIVNIGNFTDETCVVILVVFGEEFANESFILPSGTSSTTISFRWNPDWLGQMELLVIVDSDDLIEERNENNTLAISLLVTEPVKESFLASTGRIAGTGLIGILALIGVGATMMFLRSRDSGEEYEDYSEYVEDDANL